MSIAPSPIQQYFDGLLYFISHNPLVVNVKINRMRVGSIDGFVDLDINLARSHRLTISEYYTTDSGVLRYRYHLMDDQNNPRIRWDNAPHYRNISTFPDHIHNWNHDQNENILDSQQPDVYELFSLLEEMWNDA